jgi:hypothetical protein
MGEKMFSSAEILAMKEKLKGKKESTDAIKKFILEDVNLSLKDKFVIALSELSSQMYGPLLQKLLIDYFETKNVSKSLNKGDCKTNTEKYYEIKCGLVNLRKIKLFQVRPYQKIDGYISCHYDADKDILVSFLIPHSEMKIICSSIVSSSHGTGEFADKEKQVEIEVDNLQKFNQYIKSLENIRATIR